VSLLETLAGDTCAGTPRRDGTMDPSFEALVTPHLELEPITEETARAIVAGDLSALRPAEGWPHDDTVDGLSMALRSGHPAGWLVTLEGRVIGDCGVHGWTDETGGVEIGYGIAAPYRERGYGTETVTAMTDWFRTRPEVRIIRARTAEGNTPSRRVLEKAGFELVGVVGDEVLYRRPC